MQRNRRRAAAKPTFVKFLRARPAARSDASCAARTSALKPGCCAVAKQSKPRWGFEAHERARFAGWRRSLCAVKRTLSEVAGTFSVPFGSPKGTPQKQDAVESSEAPHGGAQRKRKPKEKKEQFIVFLPRLWYTCLVCTRKSALKFVTGVSLFWEETPYEVSLLR